MQNNISQKFIQKVEATRSGNIFLVTGGKDKSGYDAWYYVQVEPLKISLFQKMIKSGAIKLDEFGKILESGFGKTPDEMAIKKMKEQYNFTAE